MTSCCGWPSPDPVTWRIVQAKGRDPHVYVEGRCSECGSRRRESPMFDSHAGAARWMTHAEWSRIRLGRDETPEDERLRIWEEVRAIATREGWTADVWQEDDGRATIKITAPR